MSEEWPDLLRIGPYVLQTVSWGRRKRVQVANWSDGEEVPSYHKTGADAIAWAKERCSAKIDEGLDRLDALRRAGLPPFARQFPTVEEGV